MGAAPLVRAGRYQSIRDFTVKIMRESDGEVVGSGVVVSARGEIVTCAHVLADAGVRSNPSSGFWSLFSKAAEHVLVALPWDNGTEAGPRRASIAARFSDKEDDVVLLKLAEPCPPVGSEYIAVLGSADDSTNNDFRSYGYRKAGKFVSAVCDGVILGPIETDDPKRLHAEPIQLKSSQIGPGFSGAGVLDIKRNLVVGIISDTYFATGSEKGRDDGWAVNARILSLAPLGCTLRDAPLPVQESRVFEPGQESRQANPARSFAWNTAPLALQHWVGREGVLSDLTDKWRSATHRVIGCIGPAGAGKSSVVRRWLDQLISAAADKPDSLFWWSFNDRPSVEAFVTEAFAHFVPSTHAGAHVDSTAGRLLLIAGLLHSGRHILVLDGLEVLQESEAAAGGRLSSPSMATFLANVATSEHQSLCVITSRVSVVELMTYSTCSQRTLDPLTKSEARDLLGDQDVDVEADVVTSPATVDPFTLAMLSRLSKQSVREVTARSAGAHQARTQHSEGTARIAIEIFTRTLPPGTLRVATAMSASTHTLEASAIARATDAALVDRTNQPTSEAETVGHLNRLISALICRAESRSAGSTHYHFSHPLYRAYFEEQFQAWAPNRRVTVHVALADWYRERITAVPERPSFSDVEPILEAAFHLCRAGEYIEAWNLLGEKLDGFKTITYHMASYETAYRMFLEFFPARDASRTPEFADLRIQRFIMNSMGLCLVYMGRPAEAETLYERKNVITKQLDERVNTSLGYTNLAELKVFLGQLSDASDAAAEGLRFAKSATKEPPKIRAEAERTALAYLGWIAGLRGDLKRADRFFSDATAIEKRVSGEEVPYLFSNRGVFHADHLLRTAKREEARQVAAVNLAISTALNWPQDISRNHRVLGDIALAERDFDRSLTHYESALAMARQTSFVPALIQALIGRADWLIEFREPDRARLDIDEALELCLESSYRLLEIDARVRRAAIKRLRGNVDEAEAELQGVVRSAKQAQYHWGQEDAQTQLALIKSKA